MTATPSQPQPPQAFKDLAARRTDGFVHVIGLTLCPLAALYLIIQVAATGGGLALAAAAVYCVGMLATFGFSAAYHFTSEPILKETIRACDHAAIFVMIAGTYTPFALFAVGGHLGWGILALVWLLAVCGVQLKLFWPRRWDRSSVLLYLIMGWIGLPAVGTLFDTLPGPTLALLGVGGILYTFGVGFHLWDRLRFQNALWHLFVLSAAGCHYVAVISILT